MQKKTKLIFVMERKVSLLEVAVEKRKEIVTLTFGQRKQKNHYTRQDYFSVLQSHTTHTQVIKRQQQQQQHWQAAAAAAKKIVIEGEKTHTHSIMSYVATHAVLGGARKAGGDLPVLAGDQGREALEGGQRKACNEKGKHSYYLLKITFDLIKNMSL